MAYDSVSRGYLFALLRKTELPEWTINVIEQLYKDVQAFPILQESHETVIHMPNGLKQGCPLSPLLYLLALDPLLVKIADIPNVDASLL